MSLRLPHKSIRASLLFRRSLSTADRRCRLLIHFRTEEPPLSQATGQREEAFDPNRVKRKPTCLLLYTPRCQSDQAIERRGPRAPRLLCVRRAATKDNKPKVALWSRTEIEKPFCAADQRPRTIHAACTKG